LEEWAQLFIKQDSQIQVANVTNKVAPFYDGWRRGRIEMLNFIHEEEEEEERLRESRKRKQKTTNN
jgi:hypothetical protein